MTGKTIRPTKKQAELLDFISQFIAEHGYGPSYREIMSGLDYSSVATVAVHVNNLVANGQLIKKDRSARSLEIADSTKAGMLQISDAKVKPSDEKWLIAQVENRFSVLENAKPTSQQIDNLYVLVGALKILGFDSAVNSFKPRLSALKK